MWANCILHDFAEVQNILCAFCVLCSTTGFLLYYFCCIFVCLFLCLRNILDLVPILVSAYIRRKHYFTLTSLKLTLHCIYYLMLLCDEGQESNPSVLTCKVFCFRILEWSLIIMHVVSHDNTEFIVSVQYSGMCNIWRKLYVPHKTIYYTNHRNQVSMQLFFLQFNNCVLFLSVKQVSWPIHTCYIHLISNFWRQIFHPIEIVSIISLLFVTGAYWQKNATYLTWYNMQ